MLEPLPSHIIGLLREINFFDHDELTQATGFFIGGITNQSWAVQIRAHRFVVRLPRPGTPAALNREAEKHNTLAMSDLGINVPTLFMGPASGIKVSPWMEGAPIDAEDLRNPRILEQLSALLRQLQSSGIQFKSAFRPCFLLDDLQSSGAGLPEEAHQWQPIFEYCRSRFLDGASADVPSHGDLYRGNLFRTNERLYVIDWEHSGMNDPLYDLADFTVQADFSDAESRQFLDLYAARTQCSLSHERFWYARQLSRLVWGIWELARLANHSADPRHLTTGRRKLQLVRESLAHEAIP